MNNTTQSEPKTKKVKDRLTFIEVVKALKEEKYGFSSQLFWFVFLTIISLILAYIFPFSLIVTLPLVIIPSWFAFNSCTFLKGVKNSQHANFFNLFKAYFSPLFFGGYRLLLGFLKGFLAYIGISSIAFAIYSQVALTSNAEYQAIMELMNSPEGLDSLMAEMTNFMLSPNVAKPMYFITSISMLVGVAVFIQHVLKHSVKMRRNLVSRSPIPSKQFVLVDKKVRKDNRKLLWSSYLATSWFIQLIVILSAVGGVVIGYFFLTDLDPLKAGVLSLFLGFVLLIPLLNYISTIQNMLYIGLRHKYDETFVTMTLEFLTKYKTKLGIEEEEAQKLENILNETKRLNEEDKKKEEEDNSEEE